MELWKKYEDKWLVSLLFDDLLDANNWAVRERTREPLGLIALGTSTGQFAYEKGSTTTFSCDHTDQVRSQAIQSIYDRTLFSETE